MRLKYQPKIFCSGGITQCKDRPLRIKITRGKLLSGLCVCVCVCVCVSLTVHPCITLANDQLDAQVFFITFITILYMFRAICCSSSGGQIIFILVQHLVSSLSASFSTCAPDGHLLRVTIPEAVLIQFDLLRMSKILLETCRGL